jgi:hypothetical protein
VFKAQKVLDPAFADLQSFRLVGPSARRLTLVGPDVRAFSGSAGTFPAALEHRHSVISLPAPVSANIRWIVRGTSRVCQGPARHLVHILGPIRAIHLHSVHGPVAQWQSRGFLTPRFSVRVRAGSPRSGAGDGPRTRNIQLGRLTLCRLSYSREVGSGTGTRTPVCRARTCRPTARRSPNWWTGPDSNRRPPRLQRGARPTELPVRCLRPDSNREPAAYETAALTS